MSIIKKEWVYYHWNVYKIISLTILRQCLGPPHHYCCLSPQQAALQHKSFCVSQNPKHYSNETETIGLIDSVINPYLVQKCKELGPPPSQKALLIWDVFRGQKSQGCSKLSSLNIEVISVPANMAHFSQPLDLTVNRQIEKFCKNKFATWYSAEVQKQVDSGVNFEDADVDLKLSVLKPIHATWLADVYNFLTNAQERGHVLKGWEKAGIKGVVSGREVSPPVDPYQDIYPNESWDLWIYF